MNTQNFDKSRPQVPYWIAPFLLFLSGIALIAGYNMHLVGFIGWTTLVIAGASLFVSGGLLGQVNKRPFALLALSVAIIGLLMCTPIFFSQIRNGEFIAAITNLFIVSSQFVAGFLLWQILRSQTDSAHSA